MSLSVCIRCGATNPRPLARCRRCGFAPSTDDERAKSLLLSLDAELDGEYLGRTREELLALSRDFARSPPSFDPALVQRVIAHAHSVSAVTPRRLVIDLARWAGVPLLLLAAVLPLLHFAR